MPNRQPWSTSCDRVSQAAEIAKAAVASFSLFSPFAEVTSE